MIYTIAELVSYARSRDNRLEDVDRYPTAVMESLVEEGFAIAQDIRPIFTTTEKYNLEASVVTDGLVEMEIILQKEPQAIKLVHDYDDSFFTYEATANNHIIVRVPNPDLHVDSYTISITYFYYPLMPMTSIELSVDAYRLIKESIGAAVCAELRDYEQEQYHRTKAKALAQESAYDLEKKLLEVPEERLWRGSWV